MLRSMWLNGLFSASLIGLLLVMPRTAFDGQPDEIFTDGFESGHAPVIISTPPTTAEIGVLYSYDVDATDPDGDSLSYQLGDAPQGMAIDPESGLIEWMPTENGSFPAIAQVSDGKGGAAQQQWTIAVGTSGVSSIAISSPWVYFSEVGQSVQLTAQLFDADLSPVAGSVTWWSTAPDQVSVGANGMVRAEAIGSAQIYAETGGVRSPASLVMVATPTPDALLIYDDQVVAVGDLMPANPGELERYEVTLRNVATPAMGTILLAAELSPVSGRVIDTWAAPEGLVVLLELVPLTSLFQDYDINWSLKLADYQIQPIAPVTFQAESYAFGSLSGDQVHSSGEKLVVPQTVAPIVIKFWQCEPSIAQYVVDPKANLTVENGLTLNVSDRPNYSRRTIEGGLTVSGNASLKFTYGLAIKGTCEAFIPIWIPVGVLQFLVSPEVRIGMGAEIGGKIIAVQSELKVSGKVGMAVEVGWECGGSEPGCRGIFEPDPVGEFRYEAESGHVGDMWVSLTGDIYLFAALRGKLAGGLAWEGDLYKARLGGRKKLDLKHESAQAIDPKYSSKYGLEGFVNASVGSAITSGLKKILGQDNLSISFKSEKTVPWATSPRGTFFASADQVPIGSPVNLTVQLEQGTEKYSVLGYNVDWIQIYRRKEGEDIFSPFLPPIPVTASAQTTFQYTWSPSLDDVGAQELAAFVNTKLPVPDLEISDDTVKHITVSCFSAPGIQLPQSNPLLQAKIATKAATEQNLDADATNTCSDIWEGWTSYSDGIIEAQTEVIWRRNIDIPEDPPGLVTYFPEGVVRVRWPEDEAAGCTVSPNTFQIDPEIGSAMEVDYWASPFRYGGGGMLIKGDGTPFFATMCCPDPDGTICGEVLVFFNWWIPDPEGTVSSDGLVIEGQGSNGSSVSWQYRFARP